MTALSGTCLNRIKSIEALCGVVNTILDRELVIASLNMPHGLGLNMMAESMETREQSQFLHQRDGEFRHSYVFSKSILADEVERQVLASSQDMASS